MFSRITTVIGTIAATVAELRARWVGRRVTWYSGLTTEADAETYVTVLRATPVTPLDQWSLARQAWRGAA